MDAGARGRRLLQRREYKAKVSEFIPKELEDQFGYDKNGKLVFELDLKNVGQKLKKGFKKIISGPIRAPTINKKDYEQRVKDGTTHKLVGEASSAQEKAMHDAKMKKMEDDKVAEKKKKKVDEACWKGYEKKGMKTMFGKRYPNCVKKTKKEEVEFAEDMKGMSQKSGDKRSTESGAGMTAQGVAKYNRRTGGNLKTAVTTPPSKLKPGSKAAKRRKSFCARSKSWTGPRGKAARRRWNCSYEPELPMIIDEKKKLFNTAPLSDRVSNWSKKINEGDSYVKSDRNKFGLPKDLKSTEKKADKKTTTGVNYGAMAQSYEPQGEMIEMARKGKGAINPDILKKHPNLDPLKPSDYIKLKRLSAKVDRINERKMTSSEKDRKEKYVKGMKKDKGGFTKRYGKDGKSVMYATATKMAMKEESCGKGEYYCYDDKKCKPIPEGMKVGKDGMLVKEDFYKKKYDVRKGGYQKTNKMTKSNKRSGDSKAQYRQVHKDLAKENIFKGVKGDGYLGKTPIPNPIRLATDVVDNINKREKMKIDLMNKVDPTSGSIKIPKRFNPKISPATTRYLGIRNEGSLHSWFKGSKSKDGKPGWVNVVTGGTCASDKPGEGTPKCVSSSKRASMTKAERLSASRRKKKADPGQQSKSGAAKPTYVATDSKKKKK